MFHGSPEFMLVQGSVRTGLNAGGTFRCLYSNSYSDLRTGYQRGQTPDSPSASPSASVCMSIGIGAETFRDQLNRVKLDSLGLSCASHYTMFAGPRPKGW